MGLETEKDNGASARLIAAGRALLARGDTNFPLVRLCAEAGVSLAEFRQSFASKAALVEALTYTPGPEIPQADPWLERRLRVFERALKALEERAETDRRAQSIGLARLEEKFVGLVTVAAVHQTEDVTKEVAEDKKALEREVAREPDRKSQDGREEKSQQERKVAPEPDQKPKDGRQERLQEEGVLDTLLLVPLEQPSPAKADSEFLKQGRRAAQRAHMAEPPKRRRSFRQHALVTAGFAIIALLACAALTLSFASHLSAQSRNVMHRTLAITPLARLMALADSGDAGAQTTLAFDYLRGKGVPHDTVAAARWSEAAARQGDAEAQYLFASLARDGTGMRQDPVLSFRWFALAAASGNLKAMHNLAIAYATGDGTQKDEAAAAYWFGQAASRGYTDSAFDLAVFYERGAGVAQDVKAALYWYGTAARAGDVQAAARAQTLAAEIGMGL